MNATNHAKLRYVQRVLGIEDERESKSYLAENNEQVATLVMQLYQAAEYVWSGAVNAHRQSHFYINGDLVIVVDEPRDSIVTIFHCDFGFPAQVNRQTIRSMMNEIRKLRQREAREEERVSDKAEKVQVQLDTVVMQMNALEKQLDILKQRKDTLNKELSDIKSSPMYTRQEISKIAALLVNSIEYKMDTLNVKKSM